MAEDTEPQEEQEEPVIPTDEPTDRGASLRLFGAVAIGLLVLLVVIFALTR